ncbi:MAG: RHS repeat-associated core domain-containing protein [Nitrospira sp.]|nr:RHS repeat-associated core domain-containing protein [Nitrospira sp.]MDI3462970.1 Rhs-family protein [Nitrospira sp.]
MNGNLATTTDASGTTTYTWNVRNQLTSISGPSLSASFTYDSFGRRTGKTINGTTTNFVYDGLNPVQEMNGATVTVNLLTGLGLDEFFTRTDSVGVRSLLPDALGSTVALGDGTGTLQTQYSYEPFGFTTQTGAASTSSYKYTGREDDGSGLFYYRARYYQPRLQRFISEDPIGFLGGDINLYAYVRNNPINLIDQLGLSSSPCGCPRSDFKTTFANNLLTTNDFFFGFPENFTRTGIGLLLGSSTTISNTVGTVTLGQALKSVLLQGQGISPMTIPNTLVSGAINSALGALAVGVSLEAGIITGAAIDAGVKSLLDLGCD